MKISEMKIGSKLLANWGAMHPIEDLKVVEMFEGLVGDVVIAEDSDGEQRHFLKSSIKEYGAVSPNGSPVGVFLLPENY